MTSLSPKILACIDTRGNTDAVIDWAAWAALRLGRPLEFVHVLERHPERAASSDFSGTIGPDAGASLLQTLSEQDAQRSIVLREAGRELLAHARQRAVAAGVPACDARLRHGDFVETAVELQPQAELFVLGEHHHAGQPPQGPVEHHLDRTLRALATPVLVATTQRFAAPQCVVVAYDGSPGARRALGRLVQHPLVVGLPLQVVMVAPDTVAARQQLKEAQVALQGGGSVVSTQLAPGEPQQVLPPLVKALAPALLVLGASGHSRLRQWLRGSTTQSLLRLSDVPVLVLR
jgi:nucleotide-binding universal stress UspA family protein